MLFKHNIDIEISEKSALHNLKEIGFDDLKQIPCIIIASKNQQEIEADYYSNTLGFNGNKLDLTTYK